MGVEPVSAKEDDITGINVVTDFTENNSPINAVAFSPYGTDIASVNSGHLNLNYARGRTGTVKIWNADSGNVTSIAFSPDRRRIVSGGQDETVKVCMGVVTVMAQENDRSGAEKTHSS